MNTAKIMIAFYELGLQKTAPYTDIRDAFDYFETLENQKTILHCYRKKEIEQRPFPTDMRKHPDDFWFAAHEKEGHIEILYVSNDWKERIELHDFSITS